MRYLVLVGAITGASLIAVPFWLIISPLETQAVLINALWCLFNLLLVSAACLAAFEQPQLRRAHRLPRHLKAIIHSDESQLIGETIDVSESGAQILLDDWPNIPDEVRVELVGDFGARALLDARVIRANATDKLQALLAFDFLNPSRTQLDDLTLVLFSDVREWYAQHRTETDKPFQSLRFIATSLQRAFQDLKPADGMKVRKQVKATAKLFWEGWGERSYPAKVMEWGMHDLRVELSGIPALQLDELQYSKPTLALLIDLGYEDVSLYGSQPYGSQPYGFQPHGSQPHSLLVQVESIEVLGADLKPELNEGELENDTLRVSMELGFPPSLDRQQRSKIREILRSLS